MTGFRNVNRTIKSVILQEYAECEVILLRNGIGKSLIPGGYEVYESDACLKISVRGKTAAVREVMIHRKGKGNALNIGAKRARYDTLCVLDADCALHKDAFSKAFETFRDENVIAAGGKLISISDKKNIWTFHQRFEYVKTFEISRSLFNFFNANSLVSGAFGFFRKQEFTAAGGYDTDTVGEDMELILRLQEVAKLSGKKIVYNDESICYTLIPCTFWRLLRQRDRWQRGLLDSLIKHRRMIFNYRYGLLGMFALPYQVIVELLGPVFILLQVFVFCFIVTGFEPYFELMSHIDFLEAFGTEDALCIYGMYFGFDAALTCAAECREKKTRRVSRRIVKWAIGSAVIGAILSIPLAAARLFGMITFHWRRFKW